MLERDPSARLEGSAIGLWPNAFRALDALGVAEPLRKAHSPIQRSGPGDFKQSLKGPSLNVLADKASIRTCIIYTSDPNSEGVLCC